MINSSYCIVNITYTITELNEINLEKAFKAGDDVPVEIKTRVYFTKHKKFFSPGNEGNLINNGLPGLDSVI